MFFSSNVSGSGEVYKLALDATKYADKNSFSFVFTPERHFHEFGGLFSNPAVTSAALATLTDSIQLRAGSLISPLHDSVRIAEEWSAVDNLSNGRVALSFGSGWNVNDFVFFPDRYEKRQEFMYRQIDEVKKLWSGETLVRKNAFDKDVEIRTYPQPVQKTLPIWVTSSGNVETFKSAGAIGANILTHLIGQDLETLAGKIAVYRQARSDNDHDPDTGIVTLMLHTFLGESVDAVRKIVWMPFREYLRSAVRLELKAAGGGGSISGGHKVEEHDINEEDMEDLLDLTFERYFASGSLMGTPECCQPLLGKLKETGVNEIACLIDFLDDSESIMTSLEYVNSLRSSLEIVH